MNFQGQNTDKPLSNTAPTIKQRSFGEESTYTKNSKIITVLNNLNLLNTNTICCMKFKLFSGEMNGVNFFQFDEFLVCKITNMAANVVTV